MQTHSETTRRPNQLTAIVFKEKDHWVAMFLEKYIGAQGRTYAETIERLKIVYRAELNESINRTGEAFGGIMRTPKEYQERVDKDKSAMRITIYDKGSNCDGAALRAA